MLRERLCASIKRSYGERTRVLPGPDTLEPSFDSGARIEIIAQSVTNKVETENRQHHGNCGKQDEVRSLEKIHPAVVEHGSPACGGRRNTEAEKTHGGFGEDGAGHANRGLHDDGLNDIRKDVAHDDAQIGCTQSARSFDKFAFPGSQDLSANQARVADPSP